MTPIRKAWITCSDSGISELHKKTRTTAELSGKNGAGEGVRTLGLDLGKVALYQLSYARER